MPTFVALVAAAVLGMLIAPLTTLAQTGTDVGLASISVWGEADDAGRCEQIVDVVLTGPAPAGGAVVSLDHGGGSGPASVTIPAGLAQKTFQTAPPLAATVTLGATYQGVTKTTQYQRRVIDSLSFPATGASGAPVTGTVTLHCLARTGGASVSLNLGAGSGPAAVTVAAGQRSATFQMTLPAATASSSVTAGATYLGATASASVSVVPAAVASSLSMTVTRFRAGNTTPPAVYGRQGNVEGTVTLAQAAVAQVAVPLTSSNAAAVVPDAVTVAAGQTTAKFDVATSRVNDDTTVTISAGQGASAKTAALIVKKWPSVLTTFDVPSTIASGAQVSGAVRCNCRTYGIGLPGVTVSSSNPAVLTVTAGALSEGTDQAPLSIATRPVNVSTAVVITAVGANPSDTVTRTITLEPAAQVSAMTVSPQTIFEAGTSTVTVTLNKAAPAGGARITLRSSSAAATVPAEIIVAEGQTAATLTATAAAIGTANITAQHGNGVEKSAAVVVHAIEVLRITIPASLYESGSAAGTVDLRAPAGASAVKVALVSSGSAVTVPPEVTVAAGTSSASFAVSTSSAGSATVTAKRVGGTDERQVAVTVARVEVASLALSPASVVEGGSTTATVTLNAPAGSGGIVVKPVGIQVTVPNEVTVPAGATSATFTATAPAGGMRSRTISVARSGSATSGLKTATLAVTSTTATESGGAIAKPKAPAVTTAHVTSLTFPSTAIKAGTNTTGTVTLDAPAPSGGVKVTLKSSSPSLSVPTDVTVAPGNSSVTFTATAASSASPGSATIEAARSAAGMRMTVAPKATATLTIKK